MSDDPHFSLLVQQYMEGQATPQDVAWLNQRLRDDADARRQFRALLDLDSALAGAVKANTAAFGPVDQEPPIPATVPSVPASMEARKVSLPTNRSGRRWMASAVVLAACLLLAISAISWLMPLPVIAMVEDAAGVEGLSAGMVLPPGWCEIDAGTVELVTQRGVLVVIEAPARFFFESTQRVHLSYGRLAADVPPAAKGFTVVTPTGKAIDLGTKFGVDMPRKGDAEIHVFQGEVIAQSGAGGRRRNLRDGEAFRLQTGAGQLLNFRSAAFIQPGEVISLNAALQAGQPDRSQRAIQKLRQDPALIALLEFESDTHQPGVYRRVQGRWPGSKAAEFVNVGDHMKLDVGGQRTWSQLTLAAWVRLDHLGEPYQSLFHTDGWDSSNRGQVHWMVTRLMTMRLALRGNKLAPDAREKEGYPDSLTSVLPERGRWVHLAAVYNSDQRNVRFYLNGRFDSQTELAEAFPARLGPAQIGNWNTNDRKLSGRVDELLLLGRAMSDAELESLYAAGNPYR